MEKKLEVTHDIDENTVISDEIDLDEWEHALRVKHKFDESMNAEISKKKGTTTAKLSIKI